MDAYVIIRFFPIHSFRITVAREAAKSSEKQHQPIRTDLGNKEEEVKLTLRQPWI